MCDCQAWTADHNLCGNCADWRRLVREGYAEPVNVEDIRSGAWVCAHTDDEYRQVATVFVHEDDGNGTQWLRVEYTDGTCDIMRRGSDMFKSTRERH